MDPRQRKRIMIKEKVKRQKDKVDYQGNNFGYYLVGQKIGEGTSSRVYSAVNTQVGEHVAIKKINCFLDNKEQSLRTLKKMLQMRRLKHPNITNLRQIILEGEMPKNLALILDYLPLDLKKFICSQRILTYEIIQRILFQVLLGLRYCQESQILFQDLRPEHILISDDLAQVKICHFGVPRIEKNHQWQNLEYLRVRSQRCYRAPEIYFIENRYSSALDIWSIGCILGDFLFLMKEDGDRWQRKSLFPIPKIEYFSPPRLPGQRSQGRYIYSLHDHLQEYFSLVEKPSDLDFIHNEEIKSRICSMKHVPKKSFKQLFPDIIPEAEDFLTRSLVFDPKQRMTINEALSHSFFDGIRKDYSQSQQIKGEPIDIQLEGIGIPEMRKLIIQEYLHDQKLKENI